MPRSTNAASSTLQEKKLSVPEQAEHFVTTLRQLVAQRGFSWHAPTVSHNEVENSIEISWWRANKSLIITIEADAPIAYLKVWGPNIHHEMAGGENPSHAQLIELWQWLYA